MIVETATRSEGRAASGKSQPQRFLGPGLADTASNRNEAGPAAIASSDPELTERRQRVADEERRSRRRQIWDWPIHHCGRCSAFKCRSDEIMAVMVRAAQGDEQVAGRQTAGVYRHTCRSPIDPG